MSSPLSRRTALSAGLAAVITGFVASCGSGSPSSPAATTATSPSPAPSEPFDAKIVEALDALMTTKVGGAGAPGGLLAVWSGNRGLLKGYGVSDISSGAPMRTDVKWRTASITKSFTATAVLLLAEENKLHLDDKLSQYVPDIANGDAITIRQLLNMTAGVYSYAEDAQFGADFDRDPATPFTLDRILAIIRGGHPSFAPGEAGKWAYSDSNYVLMDPIIRKASGRSPADFIRDRIFNKLGLSGTSYPTTPDLPPGSSRGYGPTAQGGQLRDVTQVHPGATGLAGAIVSTAADLRTWAKVFADGSMVSERLRTEQQTFVQAVNGPGLKVDYGLGMMRINGLLGHNGAVYGFNNAMLRDPESDTTIVVMFNRSDNFDNTSTEVSLRVAQVLFPTRFGK